MHKAALPPPRPHQSSARAATAMQFRLYYFAISLSHAITKIIYVEGQNNEANNWNRENTNGNVDPGHMGNSEKLHMIAFGLITSLFSSFQNIDYTFFLQNSHLLQLRKRVLCYTLVFFDLICESI